MLDREPPTIPFSTEALQATLLRLQNDWETVQASRGRDAIYQYLNSCDCKTIGRQYKPAVAGMRSINI